MSSPSISRSAAEHLTVYGSTASFYTGKLEAYLRAKGVPYRLEPFGLANMRRCARHTGVRQIPQVECPDGSWLVDTTLIIEYFERTRPEPAVSPHDSAAAFLSLLLEDYADEWLWRPAMHYRWSFPETARVMSAWLAEHVGDRRAPAWMARRFWYRRQRGTFVTGDGVSDATRAAVEASYVETLDALEAIVAQRPYLLGARPSEADFGFFASMFRHFCCDPAPGRIMRERAPGVHEWVARMWNGRPARFATAPMPVGVPAGLGPLLHAVETIYLPYLDANAAAYAAGARRVQYDVQNVAFDEPVKPYRVWCRDRLHGRFMALDAAARDTVAAAFPSPDAVRRLATPSPKPMGDLAGPLPIAAAERRTPVDSWWRGR